VFSHRPSISPRSWREMSLEYKMMVIYHMVMMAMFIAGGALTVALEVGIALALGTAGVLLSLRHRRQVRWRWPGVSTKDILLALGAIGAGIIFLVAATPMFPPLQPHALPWYLAGAGIVLFNLLTVLRLMTFAETDFVMPPPQESAAESEGSPIAVTPRWHALIRIVCTVVFVAAWLDFAAFFYLSGQLLQHGSPTLTGTQTAPLRDHGTIVYVTPEDKAWLDLLELGQAGIPIAIGLALFAQFVLGVKIIANVPTLAELRQRTSDSAYASASLEGPVKVCATCGLRNIPERQHCKRCGADLGPITP